MAFASLAQLRRYEKMLKEGVEGATWEKLDASLLETDLEAIPARKSPPKPLPSLDRLDGESEEEFAARVKDSQPESDEDFLARMLLRQAILREPKSEFLTDET